jgi:phosphopantothenoylcysteine synthetase/decarboxylase
MNLLVTAGNTLTPIDRVRCITNIFTGRTGAAIAVAAHQRGHTVRLLTSHPEAAAEMLGQEKPAGWEVISYATFDDLERRLGEIVPGGGFDGIIHCAAVSDYRTAGIYAPAAHTHFHERDGRWVSESGGLPELVDRAAGKVKSDEPELWLRLVRTPKLVDRIRTDWGFRGMLVKFKLQVGMGDEELLRVAEASRVHSAADLMVANTLEGMHDWAELGPVGGKYERVSRRQLPQRLLEVVESR